MIKSSFNVFEFPDKTKGLKFEYSSEVPKNEIVWLYENDSEFLTVFYMVNHFNSMGVSPSLVIPYFPNARMDRVHDADEEVFTLKYFCKLINSLNVSYVQIFDPHSDVCVALIDNILVESALETIKDVYISGKYDVVYFPDAGAMKRYKDFSKFVSKVPSFAYGNKVRDWDTGKILGLDIVGKINHGDRVLMVDDICSYGGTMYFSAKKLKELGAGDIDMYVSHCENSIIDEKKGKIFSEENLINLVYTTNSTLSVSHPRIKIVKSF